MSPAINRPSPAPRLIDRTPAQINWLWAAGAMLAALSLLFLYRELQLGPEWLVPVTTLVFGVLSLLTIPAALPMLAPLGVTATLIVGTVWWYLRPDSLALLVGVVASFAAAVTALLVNRLRQVTTEKSERLEQHRSAQWYAAGLSSLALSWVLYLNWFTFDHALGAELAGPRRMAITLVWLIVGLAAVARAVQKRHRLLKHIGFLFTGVAVAKALLYDTVHLTSFWRVGVLAVAGVLLMSVAAVLQRTQRLDPAEEPR